MHDGDRWLTDVAQRVISLVFIGCVRRPSPYRRLKVNLLAVQPNGLVGLMLLIACCMFNEIGLSFVLNIHLKAKTYIEEQIQARDGFGLF